MTKKINPAARRRIRSRVGPRISVSKPTVSFRAGYDAAGNGKRSKGFEGAQGEGPVRLAEKSQDTLRKRCRHVMRNAPEGSRIADVLSAWVIAGGLKPNCKDPALLAIFEQWSRFADAEGVQDFYGLQDLAFRDVVAAGEVFGRLRDRDPMRDAHLPLPMQIQLLPSEMCPVKDDSGESKSGIIYKGPGRREAYKFLPEHPGEGGNVLGNMSVVPAERVMHVMRQREIGQIRGEPWLVRGLIGLSDYDQYQDAELVRKKLSAMMAFFIQSPQADLTASGPASFNEDGTPLDEFGDEWIEEDPAELIPEVMPGATIPLPPGYEVKPSLPADVGGSYEVFIREQMRRICAAVSVPYELVSGDFSKVNDRTMRIKIKEFERHIEQWRRMLIQQFCAPVWREVVELAFLTGAWTPPAGKTVEDFYAVEWVGEPFPHIQPKQEIEAAILAIQAGLKTRSQSIRERGGDPEQIMTQRKEEIEREREMGLVFSTNLSTDEEEKEEDGEEEN